ncbi:hypothetical protein [Sagittula sp. MA-2]|uniref:hypothetical protein n=1 Tax=Sagittula sp. MA-2 TaxID=3048007 RepID=UPI0024C34DC0|nr:hypothetical protein [Sagittula sp. MA-2]WHZ35737.1 hypothetical protein QNI11_01735 [Sagittula sp. MA-2]
MTVKEITLPWPNWVLHSNSRAHWAKVHTEKACARQMAHMACLEAPRIERIPNATIFIEYYPPTKRGDIHNVPSSLKAYIDGIADAMGCDDKGFTVDYPRVWAGSGKPGKVVFRIARPADPRGPLL